MWQKWSVGYLAHKEKENDKRLEINKEWENIGGGDLWERPKITCGKWERIGNTCGKCDMMVGALTFKYTNI